MNPRTLKLLALLPLTTAYAETISFNRDVRPILSDKCYHCHGFDEKERKGGLRLDLREDALKGGDSGPTAIVPGEPDKSDILKRILSTDKEDVMPPPKLHKAVTEKEREVLRRWIAEGAKYEGHWAFIPPQRIHPPEAGAHPVDAFIKARLAREGMQLSPEADRATLIRRVSLDLTGLPPTPEEVAEFVKDQSPGAYERVVDRLLASPRYGEHFAAAWMDLARYADSNGFQSDTSRQMWHWRDWLVSALNRNLPFDQFTIEQLAGDLLPAATRDQIVATGFNRNHRLNGEGGRIVEEWFAETVIDRVETTGLTWMALTLNCCRCHDHKYDPISQKEFYQLFAFFNSNDEAGVMDEFGGAAGTRMGGNSKPVLDLPSPEQEKALTAANARIAKVEQEIAALKNTAAQRLAAWERELGASLASRREQWVPLQQETAESAGGATLTKLPDGTWLASGVNPDHDRYTISAPIGAGMFTALKIETLPHESLPGGSLGRYSNGNYVLSDVDARIVAPSLSAPLEALFTRAEANYEQKGWEVRGIVADKAKRLRGSKNKTGWAVDGNTLKVPNAAIFAAAAPLRIPEGAHIEITLRHDALKGHNIGRFRVLTSGLPQATLTLKGEMPAALRSALAVEAAKRTPEQRKVIEQLFASSGDAELKAAEARLAAAKKELGEIDKHIPNTMVMRELETPRDAFILNRGEYDKPGEKVSRALPAVLPPMPAGAPLNRLGFAQWLVSGQHPLTARVWVNRTWERYFGAGIVKTTENFGSQAEWPTHPELLDWLATEFVRIKWDMKAMHRLIVTSATYRQSSRITPEHLAKDPENKWLARAPRLRLPGEALRDQALAISGLLVEKLGGPSVRPYMPPAVWDETSVYGDMRNYKADTGDALYRRSLYTIWKRTAAPPTMLLFDSPNREICTVRRTRSNTPMQALSLLNEVTYIEAARRLAEHMMRQGGATPEARIAWAFERATARKPEAAELARLMDGLKNRLTSFAQRPEAANQLISQGDSKADASLSPVELAAYTVTANVLLNLDEVITRN